MVFVKKKLSLGIIMVLGACMALILFLRLFSIDIPFVELSHEERPDKKRKDNFSIGIYVGKDPFHLYNTKDIVNPVLTAVDVTDVEADFVADPFMVHADNKWYMFFEVMNKKSGHGDLGLATSIDGMKWKYQKIILDEPFHLAYPLVFKTENGFYMIPETNQEKSVRLYKATNFPYEWKFETILLSGLKFADSTIFYYGSKWWLFTETDPVKDGTLRLYYSDDIHGPWKEHPKSPVVDGDENIARPGGRLIHFNDKIFRVAQDDWPTYGNKLRIFEIDRLTTSEYIEHELCDKPVCDPDDLNTKAKIPRWRSDGMHQLDAHEISNGNWIACVDGITRAKMYKQRVIKFFIPFTKTEVK